MSNNSKKKKNIQGKNRVETSPAQPEKKKKALLGKNKKRRLVLSLLCGLALPLVLLSDVIGVFPSLKEEINFALGDFLPQLALICLGLFALLFVAMFFWKRRVFDGVFAFVFGVTLASFLQVTFLNMGVKGLPGDGMGSAIHPLWAVGNALIWVAVIVGGMVGVFLISRKVRDTVYTVVVLVLVMILGTQVVNAGVTLLTTDVAAPVTQSDESSKYILTEEGIFEISKKENVVVFVLDRFDRNYAEYMFKTYPETFDFLDGFTYYQDNLSLHMRTWPASPSMITGLDIDFNNENAKEYAQRAYTSSEFLKAMRENDYSVKLYIDEYYSYRDAAAFDGVADNVFKTNSAYTINDPMTLAKRFLTMAVYRCAPVATKSMFDLSTNSFSGFVEYALPADKYVSNDAALYEKISTEGVTTQKKDNNFTWIHMGGSHPPYSIDENGDPRTETWKDNDENASRALRGDFLIIKKYIQALKDAGRYEDATIIITGDHPSPCGVEPERYGDNRLPTEPRLTALFVKRSGHAGTPLAKSDAPVAQCNLIPSVIASAGIKTDIDFGQPYWSENLPETRIYRHALNGKNDRDVTIVTHQITGDGRDFDNWEIIDRLYIGDLYGR